MIRVYFIWAVIATLLAGFFIWRYETKKCIETHITNIADTAVIYIPYTTGMSDGKPGIKPSFVLPSFGDNKQPTNFVIMPNIGYSPYGATFGIQSIYLKDNWSVSYNYDFVLKSHTIGFGYRF